MVRQGLTDPTRVAAQILETERSSPVPWCRDQGASATRHGCMLPVQSCPASFAVRPPPLALSAGYADCVALRSIIATPAGALGARRDQAAFGQSPAPVA